ncbi:hypothetical protein KCP76_24825 [Salmonella enterica subsp. enterica serovar Weltevreden]|nr:hypothetical protein KCP76_24825 [Salmonella enterica subsp. enterica serovar Weltevreden]
MLERLRSSITTRAIRGDIERFTRVAFRRSGTLRGGSVAGFHSYEIFRGK